MARELAAGEPGPGGDLAVGNRRRAERAGGARRVQLEEPCPDVCTGLRQLGARELRLGARVAAVRRRRQVLAERAAIVLRLGEPPLVARVGGQLLVDPGKKFARSAANCSTCWRIQPKRRRRRAAFAPE